MFTIDPHQDIDPKLLEDRKEAVLLAARNYWRTAGGTYGEEIRKKAEGMMMRAACEYSSAVDVQSLMASMRGEKVAQPFDELRNALAEYEVYRHEVCRYKNRHAKMTATCEVCGIEPVAEAKP